MTSTPAGTFEVETRFGPFVTTDQDVVSFASGLPGFEQCRRFVLLSAPDIAPLTCLQALDDTKPSFLAVDPRLVEADYRAILSDDDRRRLDLDTGDTPLWLAFVRLDGDHASINLHAPIVVNPRRMIGLQIIPVDSGYSTTHPFGVE